MSESKVLDVGMFEIEQAALSNQDGSKKVDIAMLITDIAIAESMMSAYVSADITIYDTHALADEFPIVGEESLVIRYVDYFNNRATLNLHVYAIDALDTDDKSESQAFVMRCISPDFITSETTRIQQSFRGTISDMVTQIAGQYLNSKQIDVEPTDGDRQFVIPSFTPVETINFLARKAYSAENKSSNFIFFENREKYAFKTHEQLIKDVKGNLPERNTFYYGETKLNITERSILMNHALRLKPKKRFNLVEELRTGAALTEVIRIDPATRSFTPVIYDHADEFSSYEHSDAKAKEYHSSEFRNKYLSKENNVVNTFLTFEPTNEGDYSYSEIIPRRNSTSYYLKAVVLEMEIHGCNDIFAGSVVNLIIPEMKFVNGDKDSHPNLSGRYLVSTIQHHMAEKKWTMRLGLVKDSFVNG